MIGIITTEMKMPEGLTFGQKVRWRRQELKLTQEKLANLLGLDRGTIIDYEKDRSVPRTPQAKRKLAEVLQLEYDALYDNTLGAVAVAPKNPKGIGLNFGQLRRSFKDSSGQQLRDWKRMFKYLLNYTETLTDDDRRNILSCVEEINSVIKGRKKANRGGALLAVLNNFLRKPRLIPEKGRGLSIRGFAFWGRLGFVIRFVGVSRVKSRKRFAF